MMDYTRRQFFETMARSVGAAATASMLGISTHEPRTLPNLIRYKRTLEQRLNAGDDEDAYFLVTHADKIIVPITTPVLDVLRSSFTHDHEVAYMLFARADGTIDTFLKPPQYQERKRYRERSRVEVFFSHAEVDPIEQQDRMFVGDYHSHPATADEIRDILKDEQERRKTHSKEEARTYKRYDTTTPSAQDLQKLRLHAREECNGTPACELILRYKTQQILMFIGGLNNLTFNYEIRAFIPLHSTANYGPLLTLTKKGKETWDHIVTRYHKEDEKPLLWAEVRIEEVRK